MKVCITGVAGFIGSSVAKKLIAGGLDVLGIDCFTDYYERKQKERNLNPLQGKKNFHFVEADVMEFDFAKALSAGDGVIHEAAQPGVRASWGKEFDVYTTNNVLATQRLLEQVKDLGLKKLVFAGSSSVYGDVDAFPMKETDRPQPVSPYGVSKLASEHLCMLYHKNYGLPATSVRYFTVYGPAQRPDMAFHRICRALATDSVFPMFGNGTQTRDFTFVDDIVAGTIAALDADCAGQVINLGGGSRISLAACIEILEGIAGKTLRIDQREVQKGDVRHTAADISKAKELLGYAPKVSVADGLEAEYNWMVDLVNSG